MVNLIPEIVCTVCKGPTKRREGAYNLRVCAKTCSPDIYLWTGKDGIWERYKWVSEVHDDL